LLLDKQGVINQNIEDDDIKKVLVARGEAGVLEVVENK
jgi:hypothetical protein